MSGACVFVWFIWLFVLFCFGEGYGADLSLRASSTHNVSTTYCSYSTAILFAGIGCSLRTTASFREAAVTG